MRYSFNKAIHENVSVYWFKSWTLHIAQLPPGSGSSLISSPDSTRHTALRNLPRGWSPQPPPCNMRRKGWVQLVINYLRRKKLGEDGAFSCTNTSQLPPELEAVWWCMNYLTGTVKTLYSVKKKVQQLNWSWPIFSAGMLPQSDQDFSLNPQECVLVLKDINSFQLNFVICACNFQPI